ncbi:MAG: right-handed parallel beta-helix repeat-containing protein [Euryarchaeota archaeon]|nr:right-handed parallel beta-helix repeat-containing protein [Euryarchaeota archaeon]
MGLALALPSGPVVFVYEDGEYTFTAPLTVPAGTTVEFRNAIVHLDGPERNCTGHIAVAGHCISDIEVEGGTLRIIGSRIDRTLGDRELMIGAVGGVLEIRESSLSRVETVYVEGGRPDGAVSVISDSAFSGTGFAVQAYYGAPLVVERNVFTGFSRAVNVFMASPQIRDNHIRASSYAGIFIAAQTDKAIPNMPLIEGNTIEDSFFGIVNLNGFPNVIRENTLRNNTVGAAIGIPPPQFGVKRPGPVFERNTLEGNHIALRTYDVSTVFGDPAISWEVHDNDFLSSRCIDIDASARIAYHVDATSNYWGSPQGPQRHGEGCEAVVGDVDVDPWRSERAT